MGIMSWILGKEEKDYEEEEEVKVPLTLEEKLVVLLNEHASFNVLYTSNEELAKLLVAWMVSYNKLLLDLMHKIKKRKLSSEEVIE